MYGDTEVMRHRVAQLRDQAVEIRSLADQLVARAEAAPWHGRAAEAMRVRIRDRAATLRDTAARHETAAEALERHAAEVDHRKDVIAAAERRVAELTAEARVRTAGGADPDHVDGQLIAFTPPPPGHKDWLTVELPGFNTGWTGRP